MSEMDTLPGADMIKVPTVIIEPSPSRAGRPHAKEPLSEGLHIRLTPQQSDLLAKFAIRHRLPISEVARRTIFLNFGSNL